MIKRIGSILHGALGDYYEQLLCLQLYKNNNPMVSIIVFFAVSNRLKAYAHFDMSFIDEIYSADEIFNVEVDEYYLFQIRDKELNANILNRLDQTIKDRIDLQTDRLPWDILKKHNFDLSPLSLHLSARGRDHLNYVMELSGLVNRSIDHKLKVGFLWRYRGKGSINSLGQYPRELVFSSINDLLKRMVSDYNAYMIVCGMGFGQLEQLPNYAEIVEEAGLALGERKNTVTELRFDLPEESVTYLPGAGYAVEMEIMSGCDLLITMPSGFSEPLWMRRKQPVIMVFPPKEYLARLWKHNMPFFSHNSWGGKWFNTFSFHSADNVIKYLKRRGILRSL